MPANISMATRTVPPAVAGEVRFSPDTNGGSARTSRSQDRPNTATVLRRTRAGSTEASASPVP